MHSLDLVQALPDKRCLPWSCKLRQTPAEHKPMQCLYPTFLSLSSLSSSLFQSPPHPFPCVPLSHTHAHAHAHAYVLSRTLACVDVEHRAFRLANPGWKSPGSDITDSIASQARVRAKGCRRTRMMRTRRVSRIRSIRLGSDGAFPSKIAMLPPKETNPQAGAHL
jgi:hypothetical protein